MALSGRGERMIETNKKTIGYIRRWEEDGKERFKFIEGKVKSIRYGKKKNSVYSDKFYTLDLEELESNTKMLGEKIMLVNEPFFTNEKYSEHCRRVVEYWNEHGATDILGVK